MPLSVPNIRLRTSLKYSLVGILLMPATITIVFCGPILSFAETAAWEVISKSEVPASLGVVPGVP